MEGKLFGYIMLFFAAATCSVPFFLFGSDWSNIKFYASPYLVLIGLGMCLAGIGFLGFKKKGSISVILVILGFICFIVSGLLGLFGS